MSEKISPDEKREERLSSKLNVSQEIPSFTERQIGAFNSKYVDSLDEALAILDEENSEPDKVQ